MSAPRSQGPPAVPDSLRDAAWTLHLDRVAVEVTTALDRRGVASILFRGRALQRFLYDDGAPRPYCDIDLLVTPDRRRPAAAVLRELGFSHRYAGETASPEHADMWVRRDDGAIVDLHWTLIGVDAQPSVLWDALAGSTARIPLAGTSIDAVAPPALWLVVALHAAQHGPARRKSIEDLERALARADLDEWRVAADLASTLGATEMFAAGLRLVPAGAGLADDLRLPRRKSVETALQSDTARPLSMGFEKLRQTPGIARKARLVGRELVPSRAFMRFWWPPSRRGALWMVLAYVRRPLWLAVHAGPGLAAWRRATSQARDGGPSRPTWARRIRALRRRPTVERVLLAEATVILAALRLALRPLGFLRLERLLDRLARRRSRSHPSANQVAWAVKRAARIVPGSTCLPQALAAKALLERHGHPAELRIGVSLDDGDMRAHAWTATDGRVVVGNAGAESYRVIASRW